MWQGEKVLAYQDCRFHGRGLWEYRKPNQNYPGKLECPFQNQVVKENLVPPLDVYYRC